MDPHVQSLDFLWEPNNMSSSLRRHPNFTHPHLVLFPPIFLWKWNLSTHLLKEDTFSFDKKMKLLPWGMTTCSLWMPPSLQFDIPKLILWGAMAKPGGTHSECHSKKHAKNPMGWYYLSLLIFVNFDMFTIHILRNCYEKMERIYFQVIWNR